MVPAQIYGPSLGITGGHICVGLMLLLRAASSYSVPKCQSLQKHCGGEFSFRRVYVGVRWVCFSLHSMTSNAASQVIVDSMVVERVKNEARAGEIQVNAMLFLLQL